MEAMTRMRFDAIAKANHAEVTNQGQDLRTGGRFFVAENEPERVILVFETNGNVYARLQSDRRKDLEIIVKVDRTLREETAEATLRKAFDLIRNGAVR